MEAIRAALARVTERFDRQLDSDIPAVAHLVRHVEHYRGKMLRPTLTLVAGLATADPSTSSLRASVPPSLSESHITLAAVCEMIHMATLVHDDVLDDADTRRKGDTVNRLHGNETAVILGDYLIASAYHLCSQLHQPAIALRVAHVAMTLCSGELLQLSHRQDFSLDEPTYFEIIDRKTASLVALACHLGAHASGASEAVCHRLDRFGRAVGIAFQIQDDILDLTARAASLGKPVGKDLEKGKLTLPLIHHLANAAPTQRGDSLRLLEHASTTHSAEAQHANARLIARLDATNSLAHARAVAHEHVARARAELAPLPSSPAKDILLILADASIARSA
jgi:octaprenyl-diphosphate synthase